MNITSQKAFLAALLALLSVLFLPYVVFCAQTPHFKVTNEMLYQKLIEIQQKQAVFEERFKQIDKRFEDMNKRFEDINKRFEDINKRFEDINKRFDQLYTFLWIITGIFTAIMVGAFGFAYWDRRTIIAEAKRQTLEEVEPDKIKKLLRVAKEFARKNKEFREIMVREGLL